MKIVIAEKISAAGQRILSEQPGWQVITPEQFAESREYVKDADALIVRSAIQADRALIEQSPKLRVIGRAGVGVDNVDVEAATERGIVVMNTPGANAVAVAEHTIGLMLALARHIPRADATIRAGKWEKKSLQGTELRGKQLGIIGLGRIGIEVAKRAQALAMSTVAFDPYVSETTAKAANIEMRLLDDLLGTSDYISLHLGLTPSTLRMVDEKAIARMKRGVRLVNCARGELIDETALLAGLQSGHIAAAALDVFTEEPPQDNPLLKHAHVIATPHIAGSTEEAQDAVGVQIAQQVVEYLRQSIVQNAVNVPSIADTEYQRLRPYLLLIEKLARLLSFLIEGNLQELELAVSASLKDLNAKLLRSYALMGVLQGKSQDVINVVNADAIARQRGVAVTIVPLSAALADDHVLGVTLRSSRMFVQAAGTVVRSSLARIIALDGSEVESPLEGSLLVVRNRDVPGVIGNLGTTLGKHGINIAHFSLGRQSANAASAPTGAFRESHAVGIIQSDVPMSASAIEAVRKIPEILSAHAVTL
jgi:D-3-phosphoglycerate dehydrogenase / 2-oxoglutarate reductase